MSPDSPPSFRSPPAPRLSAEALRRGEPEAIEQFFHRFMPRVTRVLFSSLGPDPELPDLAQEVCVQALRSLPSFRGPAESLQLWITRIAVFTARRCIRTRSRRRWIRPSDAAEHIDPVDASASPAILDGLRRALETIDRLPEDERVAFSLRFVHGMAIREVADATHVSVATVKRRLTRARERFDTHADNDPFLSDWRPPIRGGRTMREGILGGPPLRSPLQ